MEESEPKKEPRPSQPTSKSRDPLKSEHPDEVERQQKLDPDKPKPETTKDDEEETTPPPDSPRQDNPLEKQNPGRPRDRTVPPPAKRDPMARPDQIRNSRQTTQSNSPQKRRMPTESQQRSPQAEPSSQPGLQAQPESTQEGGRSDEEQSAKSRAGGGKAKGSGAESGKGSDASKESGGQGKPSDEGKESSSESGGKPSEKSSAGSSGGNKPSSKSSSSPGGKAGERQLEIRIREWKGVVRVGRFETRASRANRVPVRESIPVLVPGRSLAIRLTLNTAANKGEKNRPESGQVRVVAAISAAADRPEQAAALASRPRTIRSRQNVPPSPRIGHHIRR